MSSGKDPQISVIVPAAGFGRRVGSPESKEMLIWQGEVLIDQVFKVAKSLKAKLIVATRREKLSLIQYLKSQAYFKQYGELVFVEATREWPETVLSTEAYYSEKNLLILPDTRWQPFEIYKDMLRALDEVDLSIATHSVEDMQYWGGLQKSDEQLNVDEKSLSGPGWAWGLLAFRKAIGRPLFQAQLQSTLAQRRVVLHGVSSKEFLVHEFQDVTR